MESPPSRVVFWSSLGCSFPVLERMWVSSLKALFGRRRETGRAYQALWVRCGLPYHGQASGLCCAFGQGRAYG